MADHARLLNSDSTSQQVIEASISNTLNNTVFQPTEIRYTSLHASHRPISPLYYLRSEGKAHRTRCLGKVSRTNLSSAFIGHSSKTDSMHRICRHKVGINLLCWILSILSSDKCPSSLVGSGHVDHAAIFNSEGTSCWAASSGFTVWFPL